jgi:hypothetical protein
MIKDNLIKIAGAGAMVLALAGTTWLASPHRSSRSNAEITCKNFGFKVDQFGHIVPCTPLASKIEYNSFFYQYTDTKQLIKNRVFDKWTAVYDIKAHAVYLPDGTVLEAHSGRNEKMDDPFFVTVKNQGPTPPTLYKLTYRERPFHGVAALRLTPFHKAEVFNRDGLLAHPYFLGKRGDSKGCVSFKNYQAFLDAYRRGDFKHLVVVRSLD